MLCVVTRDNSSFRLESAADVPIGHKVALRPLKSGDAAIKYGLDIGRIVADVPIGGHVHVLNLKTKRW
jgi:(2R)-sulfolactate sulfo-lyase subunit alpha